LPRTLAWVILPIALAGLGSLVTRPNIPTWYASLEKPSGTTFGFTVFDAYDGHHALALLEARPEISHLFVDVRMPGMSGTELAEIVRKRRPAIKLVLTSGYVREEAVPDGFELVPKPWRMDQVAMAFQVAAG
jgi:CheY-like chemotaxis protein